MNEKGCWIILVFVLTTLHSCRVSYSFTGASISPNVKTISIDYFANNAPLVVPTLSRNLTVALQNYFTSQTNLTLIPQNGDLILEGTITAYDPSTPTAIQGNETAALNRFSITVKVKFINQLDETQNYESSFTRYLDYSSNPGLTPSVQDELMAGVIAQLVEDIFNKSVVNW